MIYAEITVESCRYLVDFSQSKRLSRTMNFNHSDPRHFGVDNVSCKPIEAGSFIGDVNQGGSCNVDQVILIPHCHGTHTESCGHLIRGAAPMSAIKLAPFLSSYLLSVRPKKAGDCQETYEPISDPNDLVLTARDLRKHLTNKPKVDALIVRAVSSGSMTTKELHAAYFTNQAMQFIVDRGIKHILIEQGSVDRTYDQGFLSNHRIFWELPAKGEKTQPPAFVSYRTITEFLKIDKEIPDGLYALNISFPSWTTDAVPSTITIYALKELSCSSKE